VLAGAWSAFWTYLILKSINFIIPVRVDAATEDQGQGLGEHGEVRGEW
jgi:ammonia channel protein AmtB